MIDVVHKIFKPPVAQVSVATVETSEIFLKWTCNAVNLRPFQ